MFKAEHLGNHGTWRTKLSEVFRKKVQAQDPPRTDITYRKRAQCVDIAACIRRVFHSMEMMGDLVLFAATEAHCCILQQWQHIKRLTDTGGDSQR